MKDIALENLKNQKELLENYYAQLRKAKLKASQKFTDDIGREMTTESTINGIQEKIDEEVKQYIALLKQVSGQVSTRQLQINQQETNNQQLVAELLAAIKAMTDQNTNKIIQILEGQSQTAALKLEGSIPLIPGFLTLKGDVTQTETWLGIADKISSFLEINENPHKPRQEPTLN